MPKLSAGELTALIALLIVGGMAHSLIWETVPTQNHDYMLILLGILSSGVGGGAVGYSMGKHAAKHPDDATASSVDSESPPP